MNQAKVNPERDHVERNRDENENERGFTGFHGRGESRHNLRLDQARNTCMRSSTTDKVQGAAREAKGKVKETAGKAVGNPNLRDRGTAEKMGGKAQRKVGDVKKVFGK